MSGDWHESIQRCLVGSATEEETAELQQELKKDAGLRALYLDYINLDLALEAKAEAMEETHTPKVVSISSLDARPTRNRSRWRPLAAAAAIAALIVVSASLLISSRGEPVAKIQTARKSTDFSAGEQLRTDQILKLSSGRIKIGFESGAILAVKAPAELRILGTNSAQLKRGLVTVRVPGRIKGFVLHTPQERVTDLGTSFGVEVGRAGETSISVFEGEIEIGADRRLLAGQSVALASADETPREIPYAEGRYSETWQISFGVGALEGKFRLAAPSERPIPGQIEDSDSLLLFPEREDVTLPSGYLVDAAEPGLHRRPFRKSMVELKEEVRVDSFLVQYNPVRSDKIAEKRNFQGELHFDRPIVALVLQRNLLDASDPLLALPGVDFGQIFRRGINHGDEVTLSPDRRTVRISLELSDGVDQIRVLVASDSDTHTL
jgi:hypothetical protein